MKFCSFVFIVVLNACSKFKTDQMIQIKIIDTQVD